VAELTIYLRAGTDDAGRERVRTALVRHPAVASAVFVGADDALARFTRELPELAALIGALETNPLPAAFEVHLRESGHREQDEAAARSLVQELASSGVVEDVRYDRRIFERMIDGLRLVRRGGTILATVLVLAAIVTITSVLRLAYLTRRDEVGVLFLIGLPPAAIRGPFVVEGVLQTLAGSVLAVVLLSIAFGAANAQVGGDVGRAFGVGGPVFLSPAAVTLLVLAGVMVGALAGVVAAWKEP
jgi:cell division transport system permease protein